MERLKLFSDIELLLQLPDIDLSGVSVLKVKLRTLREFSKKWLVYDYVLDMYHSLSVVLPATEHRDNWIHSEWNVRVSAEDSEGSVLYVSEKENAFSLELPVDGTELKSELEIKYS